MVQAVAKGTHGVSVLGHGELQLFVIGKVCFESLEPLEGIGGTRHVCSQAGNLLQSREVRARDGKEWKRGQHTMQLYVRKNRLRLVMVENWLSPLWRRTAVSPHK